MENIENWIVLQYEKENYFGYDEEEEKGEIKYTENDLEILAEDGSSEKDLSLTYFIIIKNYVGLEALCQIAENQYESFVEDFEKEIINILNKSKVAVIYYDELKEDLKLKEED
jgi:hypothetical protein